MFRKLFLAAAVFFCLTSCRSKVALNYSQEFVKQEQKLTPEIQRTEMSVKTFLTNEQFDSIGAVSARMENIVDGTLKEIEEKPAPEAKEADKFKYAGIRYFSFIKSVYTSYKEYGYARSPGERDSMLTNLRNIVKQKAAALADIKSAQQKFADANDFKLEK